MKRMYCFCFNTDVEDTCSSRQKISSEHKILFDELKELQSLLKKNDEPFINVNELHDLFIQCAAENNNICEKFNNIFSQILNEFTQLCSMHKNVLVSLNNKILAHTKFLKNKQIEDTISKKILFYINTTQTIINTVTEREKWIKIKKIQKTLFNGMDAVAQITWESSIDFNMNSEIHKNALTVFLKKKIIIINMIDDLLLVL